MSPYWGPDTLPLAGSPRYPTPPKMNFPKLKRNMRPPVPLRSNPRYSIAPGNVSPDPNIDAFPGPSSRYSITPGNVSPDFVINTFLGSSSNVSVSSVTRSHKTEAEYLLSGNGMVHFTNPFRHTPTKPSPKLQACSARRRGALILPDPLHCLNERFASLFHAGEDSPEFFWEDEVVEMYAYGLEPDMSEFLDVNDASAAAEAPAQTPGLVTSWLDDQTDLAASPVDISADDDEPVLHRASTISFTPLKAGLTSQARRIGDPMVRTARYMSIYPVGPAKIVPVTGPREH